MILKKEENERKNDKFQCLNNEEQIREILDLITLIQRICVCVCVMDAVTITDGIPQNPKYVSKSWAGGMRTEGWKCVLVKKDLND